MRGARLLAVLIVGVELRDWLIVRDLKGDLGEMELDGKKWRAGKS